MERFGAFWFDVRTGASEPFGRDVREHWARTKAVEMWMLLRPVLADCHRAHSEKNAMVVSSFQSGKRWRRISGHKRMNRAVFLDRDGTIIEDRDYLSRPEDLVLLPGAAVALARLRAAGFKLFLVSNQSGVGRGYFTLEDVERVNQRLVKELADSNVRFERIYFAPEAPEAPSRGRKPSPQFLFDARDEFGVELGASFMIGDKLSDLECGWNAGVKQCILVRTGYGARVEREAAGRLGAAAVLDDMSAAAEWILSELKRGGGADDKTSVQRQG